MQNIHFQNPDYHCAYCPRLNEYLCRLREELPGGYHGPVPAFGGLDAKLLIVGLAPGARGANYTGRPFTGDGAGDVLYPELTRHGFAQGEFQKHKEDGLTLINCRITNAVRCVPPENKPKGAEIKNCNIFLQNEIKAMPALKIILTLGRISHEAVLKALGMRKKDYLFAHGACHKVQIQREAQDDERPLFIVNSYHCSRYNMNTRRLTPEMFADIFKMISNLCLSK